MISQNNLPKDVHMIKGPQGGPSVAIFAGVHGDERAGIMAVNKLLPDLKISKGTLYIAYANPPAIESGSRKINKNLNRCFFEDNKGSAPEDERARELMRVLDECEALLDLHAYDDVSGDPFTICEDNSLDLASKLEPPIVSTNWTYTEPGGTDAYMYLSGKIGICVECGHIKEPEKYLPLAVRTIQQFLTYFDMLDEPVELSTTKKMHIRAEKGVVRTSEDFWLDPSLRSFDRLDTGKIYCRHDGQDFVASEGEYIIFPLTNPEIDTEAFVIGKEMPIKDNSVITEKLELSSNK